MLMLLFELLRCIRMRSSCMPCPQSKSAIAHDPKVPTQVLMLLGEERIETLRRCNFSHVTEDSFGSFHVEHFKVLV